jgi:hypothetical protein
MHPSAGITVALFVAATLANFLTLDWRLAPLSYAIGSTLLASPFAVLFTGHLTIAKTWRRNVFLAVGSVLFVAPWLIVSFALRWFQPGWAGIAVATAALVVLAAGYLLLALLMRERH